MGTIATYRRVPSFIILVISCHVNISNHCTYTYTSLSSLKNNSIYANSMGMYLISATLAVMTCARDPSFQVLASYPCVVVIITSRAMHA